MARDRPVMAVPGSVRSPVSSYTNGLLADGCHPVRDALDVLVALGPVQRRRSTAADRRPAPGAEEAPGARGPRVGAGDVRRPVRAHRPHARPGERGPGPPPGRRLGGGAGRLVGAGHVIPADAHAGNVWAMGWEQEAFVRSLSSLSANTVEAYRRDVARLRGLGRAGPARRPGRRRPPRPAPLPRLPATRRMAKRSIARKAAALRRYFAWLTRTGVLATDPSRRLSAPRGEGRLPHVLKAEELETLLADQAPAGRAGGPPRPGRGRAAVRQRAAGGGAVRAAARPTSTSPGASSWSGARGPSSARCR